jgi:hypothetical protein
VVRRARRGGGGSRLDEDLRVAEGRLQFDARVEDPLRLRDPLVQGNLRVDGLRERLSQLPVAGLEALGQLHRVWLTAKRPWHP